MRGALVAVLVLLGCGLPPPECIWDADCYRAEAAPCGSCIINPDGGCTGYASAVCREHHCAEVCSPR